MADNTRKTSNIIHTVDDLKTDVENNSQEIQNNTDAINNLTIPKAANDGKIKLNSGKGIDVTGTDATANQSKDTSWSVAVDNTVALKSDIPVIPAPVIPGDGAISLTQGDGVTVSGSNATANQTGNTGWTVKTDNSYLNNNLNFAKPDQIPTNYVKDIQSGNILTLTVDEEDGVYTLTALGASGGGAGNIIFEEGEGIDITSETVDVGGEEYTKYTIKADKQWFEDNLDIPTGTLPISSTDNKVTLSDDGNGKFQIETGTTEAEKAVRLQVTDTGVLKFADQSEDVNVGFRYLGSIYAEAGTEDGTGNLLLSGQFSGPPYFKDMVEITHDYNLIVNYGQIQTDTITTKDAAVGDTYAKLSQRLLVSVAGTKLNEDTGRYEREGTFTIQNFYDGTNPIDDDTVLTLSNRSNYYGSRIDFANGNASSSDTAGTVVRASIEKGSLNGQNPNDPDDVRDGHMHYTVYGLAGYNPHHVFHVGNTSAETIEALRLAWNQVTISIDDTARLTITDDDIKASDGYEPQTDDSLVTKGWVTTNGASGNLPISSTDNKVTLSDDGNGKFQIETVDYTANPSTKEVRLTVNDSEAWHKLNATFTSTFGIAGEAFDWKIWSRAAGIIDFATGTTSATLSTKMRLGPHGTVCHNYSSPLPYINNYDMRQFDYPEGSTPQSTVYGNFQGGYVSAQPSIKNVQLNRTYMQYATPNAEEAAEIAENDIQLNVQHFTASEINDSKGRPIQSVSGFYCGQLCLDATDSYAFRTGNAKGTDPNKGCFSFYAGGGATNYFRGTISQGMLDVPTDDGTAESRLNRIRIYDNQHRAATGLGTDRQAAGFGVTTSCFHVGTSGPINTQFNCGDEAYAYVRHSDQHIVFGKNPTQKTSSATGVKIVEFDTAAASYVAVQVQPVTPPSVNPSTGGSAGSMTALQAQVYQTNDAAKYIYAFNGNRPVYDETWGNGVTSGSDVTTDEFYGYHIYSCDKSKSKRNVAFRSAFNKQTLPAVGEVGEEGYAPSFLYDNWNVYCDGNADNFFNGDIKMGTYAELTGKDYDGSILFRDQIIFRNTNSSYWKCGNTTDTTNAQYFYDSAVDSEQIGAQLFYCSTYEGGTVYNIGQKGMALYTVSGNIAIAATSSDAEVRIGTGAASSEGQALTVGNTYARFRADDVTVVNSNGGEYIPTDDNSLVTKKWVTDNAGGGGGGVSGVSKIIGGTNITVSPLGGTGNVTVNADLSNIDVGVTKIIGGDNVTVSPADGTGNVIINATSSAGGADSLVDLDDVVVTDPKGNEVLTYDIITGKWINKAPPSGGGGGGIIDGGQVPGTGSTFIWYDTKYSYIRTLDGEYVGSSNPFEQPKNMVAYDGVFSDGTFWTLDGVNLRVDPNAVTSSRYVGKFDCRNIGLNQSFQGRVIAGNYGYWFGKYFSQDMKQWGDQTSMNPSASLVCQQKQRPLTFYLPSNAGEINQYISGNWQKGYVTASEWNNIFPGYNANYPWSANQFSGQETAMALESTLNVRDFKIYCLDIDTEDIVWGDNDASTRSANSQVIKNATTYIPSLDGCTTGFFSERLQQWFFAKEGTVYISNTSSLKGGFTTKTLPRTNGWDRCYDDGSAIVFARTGTGNSATVFSVDGGQEWKVSISLVNRDYDNFAGTNGRAMATYEEEDRVPGFVPDPADPSGEGVIPSTSYEWRYAVSGVPDPNPAEASTRNVKLTHPVSIASARAIEAQTQEDANAVFTEEIQRRSPVLTLTQAEYDAIPADEIEDETLYLITS